MSQRLAGKAAAKATASANSRLPQNSRLPRPTVSWPGALAFSGWLPTVLGFVAWLPVVRISGGVPERDTQRLPTSLPWRSPRAWFISVFFGSQSLLYLSVLTWLPPLYVDRGLRPDSAGLLLLVLNLAQIPASIGSPALADRTEDRWPWLAVTTSLATGGFAGISVFPLLAPWVWVLLLGIGLGGLFALSLTLPADNAPDADEAGRLAATTLHRVHFVFSGTICGRRAAPGDGKLRGLVRRASRAQLRAAPCLDRAPAAGLLLVG